jgi:hypothetical protein
LLVRVCANWKNLVGVQNGGSVRGYQELPAPLAIRAMPE